MRTLLSRLRARLAERISGETVAAVRAERAALDARVKELTDLSVRDVNLSATDGLRVALAAECVPQIAMLFAAHFRASGAENYVEMGLHDPVTGEFFTVTVRKVIGGKTPHQLREQAERERDAAKRALAHAFRALTPEVVAALRNARNYRWPHAGPEERAALDVGIAALESINAERAA